MGRTPWSQEIAGLTYIIGGLAFFSFDCLECYHLPCCAVHVQYTCTCTCIYMYMLSLVRQVFVVLHEVTDESQ